MDKEIGVNNKENKRTKLAVDVAIFNNKEEVLLGKRLAKEGFETWGFPGGRMQVGEKIRECAKRELREELGTDIEVEITDQILGIRENNIPPNFVPHLTVILKGLVKRGEPRIMEPNKCSEWKFFNVRDLNDYPLFSGIKEILENFSKGSVLAVTDWQKKRTK